MLTSTKSSSEVPSSKSSDQLNTGGGSSPSDASVALTVPQHRVPQAEAVPVLTDSSKAAMQSIGDAESKLVSSSNEQTLLGLGFKRMNFEGNSQLSDSLFGKTSTITIPILSEHSSRQVHSSSQYQQHQKTLGLNNQGSIGLRQIFSLHNNDELKRTKHKEATESDRVAIYELVKQTKSLRLKSPQVQEGLSGAEFSRAEFYNRYGDSYLSELVYGRKLSIHIHFSKSIHDDDKELAMTSGNDASANSHVDSSVLSKLGFNDSHMKAIDTEMVMTKVEIHALPDVYQADFELSRDGSNIEEIIKAFLAGEADVVLERKSAPYAAPYPGLSQKTNEMLVTLSKTVSQYIKPFVETKLVKMRAQIESNSSNISNALVAIESADLKGFHANDIKKINALRSHHQQYTELLSELETLIEEVITGHHAIEDAAGLAPWQARTKEMEQTLDKLLDTQADFYDQSVKRRLTGVTWGHHSDSKLNITPSRYATHLLFHCDSYTAKQTEKVSQFSLFTKKHEAVMKDKHVHHYEGLTDGSRVAVQRELVGVDLSIEFAGKEGHHSHTIEVEEEIPFNQFMAI